ncbi:hypothetical protein CSA56_11055 [candidate division KSB3 bacterium]|uniref:histidine kinase n=1 Tax=candidate division KSB3 bacterium TaxID=2044937 RepID=A0A2G6KDD7_9BACT|nr:MAG: hypothetical protein CSA56_11055 [candidate division KSB3 bacterium]
MFIDDIQNATLLIVSDNPLRLGPFVEYLRSYGFTISMIDRGEDAVKIARERQPNMVILDVFLPEGSSFETCRQVKAHGATTDIPVIFISTMPETSDKVKGFEAGGVDYITRPFHQEEVLARITAHLKIRALQQRLQEKNAHLQQEIQHRQQIEEALRESEERFQTLTEAAFEGVIVHDKGEILDVNHAIEEMFGFDRSELIGKNALDLMMGEFRQGILSNIRSEYEHVIEGEGRRKDGLRFPVELQAKAMPYQGRSVRVAAIRDITWRKQAERALLESQQYTKNVIESSLDMIITVDPERRIVKFNSAAQYVFGYRPEEVLGQPINILYANPTESALVHHQMIEKGQVIQEVLNKRKNGEEFPCLLAASTLYDAQGQTVGYMGISRDITDYKKAQDAIISAHNELKQKNKQLQELNASKDKFFSIISHDLKSPFSILLGFAELLAANIEQYDKPKIETLACRLLSAANKLYALLENLLTWSKIQRGLMECVPELIRVHDLVRDNIELFAPQAEKKQIALVDDTPHTITIYADVSMIKTVLRNLLSNALKFTSANGTVVVSAQSYNAHYTEIVISDTGVGVPPDVLPHLLRIDSQYTHIGTAGEEGSGLGLILCKELVEQSGGSISVQSELGKGTTFSIKLPKAAKK